LHYLFPKPQYKDGIYYDGQRQKWFLLEYHGPLPDAYGQTEQEFSRFDWVSARWLIEQTPPYKRNVYKTIVAVFTPFFPT
jgi:putative (di)nucleoside polyphosphate hydrolase